MTDENESRRGYFFKWVLDSKRETISKLAAELGLTRTGLSYKINGYVSKTGHVFEFTPIEMQYISNKFGFTEEEEIYAFIDDSGIRDKIDLKTTWRRSKEVSETDSPEKKPLKRVRVVATAVDTGEEMLFESLVSAERHFCVGYGVIYNRIKISKNNTLMDINGKRWTFRYATEEDKLKFLSGKDR